MNGTFKKIWQIPFWLGLVTLFGLLAALLGTGVWYWVAWLAMLLPLAAIGYHIRRSRSKDVVN